MAIGERSANILAGLAGFVVFTGLTQAASAAESVAARPDLSGIWQTINSANHNLEPHEGRPGTPAGMGVVEGGVIPYKPEALAKRAENARVGKTEDPLSKCYLPGVPRATYVGLPFQIFQTDVDVVILYEYAHTTRVIPTNNKPFIYDGEGFWMGESRGHYEGNTLVIETRNFNDLTWFDRAGNYHSEQLNVVERFTKTEPNLIMYEARIEDPQVFTRPWTISMPLYRRREANIQLLEYECYAFPGYEPPTAPPPDAQPAPKSKSKSKSK